jgi:molecular chaperone GrpE (heat shock protein)
MAIMLDREVTSLPKWPFLAGGALLVAVAAWIYLQFRPLAEWHVLSMASCALAGAGLVVLPYVLEHRARLRLTEVRGLTTVAEQMAHLRSFTNQISFATAQWNVAQEHAEKVVDTAKGLSERMTTEAQAFTDFLRESNENEKRQLKLEIEKLRKAEVEWLQIAVRLLDHVYALHQAGVRSGQSRLAEQLSRFQHACRDTVRRVGLVPFEPSPDEIFNEHLHQLHDSEHKPAEGARIEQTLAPGFNYQGRLLRPAVVAVAGNGATTNSASVPSASASNAEA